MGGPPDVRRSHGLRNDYKVSFRAGDSLNSSALNARRLLVPEGRPDFSMRAVIERLLSEELLPEGKLRLKLTPRPYTAPACVTFRPRTLNIDPEYWDDSRLNFPDHRFVLGHELGHIDLHDHHAQSFSGLSSAAWPKEESSEWQADKFSELFLVTENDIQIYGTTNAIANYCAVPRDIVIRRLGNRFRYTENCCPRCGEFKMMVIHFGLKCDNCDFEKVEDIKY